jgi:hypothetical protein
MSFRPICGKFVRQFLWIALRQLALGAVMRKLLLLAIIALGLTGAVTAGSALLSQSARADCGNGGC